MRTKTLIFTLTLTAIMLGFSSCSTIPEGVTAVQSFDKASFLGKWYEIARIDFKYEKDMNNTTAEYSLNPNGTIKVVNKGYNTVKKEWGEAVGKAKFVGADDLAMLKVSFFGPFYAGYNVIAIDTEYQYALIAGAKFKYLWILSRETTIPEEIKASYLKIAQDFGFDTSQLLWIEHNDQK